MEQIYIRENSTLSRMCHLSKNLYNQVNYILRNQFLNHEKLSGYNELAKQFSIPSDMEEHNNYQKLPAQTAQWTIRKVVQSWNSFFKALKTWKKHPDIFMGKPKPPGYRKRDGEFMLIFTNQQCRIHEGILKFPEIMETEVKTRLNDVNIRDVRIIPQGSGYTVEIVYLKEIADIPGMNPEFQSANGKLIHADLNGSYNIIKKAIPELKWNGIEGIGLYPVNAGQDLCKIAGIKLIHLI